MKYRIFIYAVFLIPVFSSAQPDTKTSKIKELMDITGAGKLGVQMINTLVSSFKQEYSTVDSAFWDEFTKEVSVDELVNLIIPVYNKYYTEKDLDELISFYKSPIGKKVTQLTPSIMQESIMVGQNWGQAISQKAISRLKTKGYLKS